MDGSVVQEIYSLLDDIMDRCDDTVWIGDDMLVERLFFMLNIAGVKDDEIAKRYPIYF